MGPCTFAVAVTFGLACCAMELMQSYGPKHDLARLGMEVSRNTPRQADLMIVAGRVSQKMAPVLRQPYDQMPEPKWARHGHHPDQPPVGCRTAGLCAAAICWSATPSCQTGSAGLRLM